MANPYDEALEFNPADEMMREMEPPGEIAMAIDNFERRMSDPDATIGEWVAIYRRYGGRQGVQDYIQRARQLRDAWKK